jgi:hypothetical protein
MGFLLVVLAMRQTGFGFNHSVLIADLTVSDSIYAGFTALTLRLKLITGMPFIPLAPQLACEARPGVVLCMLRTLGAGIIPRVKSRNNPT